jgi:ligand-binding sensor domain-containing protein
MKKLLTIYLIYFLFGQNLFSQTPHFRNYTVDDGLPSSLVYRAFQDSKGFIWFCTDKGLARFDGYKFEKFTTKNGLPNNDVWQCAEDSHQRIWFLSYANAFFYFDLKDEKFHVIENPYKELHDNHIWSFVYEGNNKVKIFLSTTPDLLILDLAQNKIIKRESVPARLQNQTCYPLKQGVEINSHFTQSFSNGGGIFIRIFSEGLQHNIKHSKHIIPDLKKIPPSFWNQIASMIFEDDKTIYATNREITFYKENKFYVKPLKTLSNKSKVLQLILNSGDINRKLVLTNNDSFIIDENINRLTEFDFIKGFNINTVFFDKEGSLWLCTRNRGLFLLSKKAINSKIYSDFGNQSIITMSRDKNNRIWMGTDEGKLYYLDNNNQVNQQRFSHESRFPIKQVIAKDDFLSILWGGHTFTSIPQNKLCLKNPVLLREKPLEKYLPFTEKKPFVGDYLFVGKGFKAFDVIGKNNFVLSTAGNMNHLFIHPKNFEIREKFRTTKIFCIKYVNKEIFAGTNKGLLKVDKQDVEDYLTKYKAQYPMLTKPITCFETDSQNALWVGTDGYGIYRFYENKVLPIPELSGIIVNNLYTERENNRLWVATNEGIFLLRLNFRTAQLTYNIQKISLAQGLPTLEVNSLIVRRNELFVGTSKGLTMIPLKNIIENNIELSPVPLIIKNIKINRQDTTISQLYDLNYRQNNLDIDFVALSYKSDKNIKYDYKMLSSNDNSDTIWHSVQDLHKEFSLLSPGKYEFMLRAFDIDGYPSKSTKSIIFIINPPFWQTLWFKFLITFSLFSLVLAVFYIRTRNIKKKEQEKTEVNKKFAELELQALQAQMNPHFVFNALSAIQNFILNNNTEEATDYLSRFSRLMRLFLESSRNKYIALSDEKNLLEHYIKLEELRFKDKFSSEIIVDKNVSLDTEIPSMLLQPFVENAINHGLVYKEKDDGILSIHFNRNENKLVCIIEDNGIGRTKAAEIKNKSLKPYKSRSTEITEDRLRSLELIENTKIEIDIMDKTDKNDMPTGTKVTIVMYL